MSLALGYGNTYPDLGLQTLLQAVPGVPPMDNSYF
jgi:hypothetical protein